MTCSKPPNLPPSVANLRQRIQHWRLTRSKRGHMPEELWLKAAQLARKHGVYVISSTLRLNYGALKKRVENLPKRKPRVSTYEPAFVQLDPLPGISTSSSAVEVLSPEGSKLTIRFSEQNALDAVALVDAFLSGLR